MFTCQAVLAGRWASAPRRWPCRGWSHKLRRCSPPWGSRGRGACGAACLARSVAGSFGPADATQDVMSAPQRRKGEFAGAEFKVTFIFEQEKPCLIKVGSNHRVQYPLTVCSVHHDEGRHLKATTLY